MIKFYNLSIRHKLILIMTVISGITLVLATFSFAVTGFFLAREDMAEEIGIQAKMIAFNSQASLVFNAPKTAQDILSALAASSSVNEASLFTPDGRLFARYLHSRHEDHSPGTSSRYSLISGELVIREPIILDADIIGSIVIHASLDKLYDDLWRLINLSLMILSSTLIISFFLASRLQKIFSAPIELLKQATVAVGKGQFDTKIILETDDEMGQLAHSFNAMMTNLGYIENIMVSMTDILLVGSPQGAIERVNQPDILGYTEAEMLGLFMGNVFADETHFGQTQWQLLVQTGSIRNTESYLITKSGGKIPVLISGSVMHNTSGKITGVILVAKEISDYKQAQQALLDKEAQLLAAEMANRSKSDFMATMSHEIRTPMNAVIGFANLALRAEALNPKIQDYLTKINVSSKVLLRIINDILDFSKIESGKLTLEIEIFQLGDVFDHVASLFCARSAEEGIEFVMEISHDCPRRLSGDALRLGQILMNLVNNALKFTKEGVIDVRVKAVKQTATQVTCEFMVRDTGIGIHEAHLGVLFDPFVQADGSITRKYGGTGLGLTICKRLVALMGGNIWVESTLEKGSIFRFTAVFGYRNNQELAAPIPPLALRGLKVLVVDDNDYSREILQSTLQTFTFLPSLAESGKVALDRVGAAIAEKTPYQLVLLDYRMPAMDGIETALRIREISRQAGEAFPPPKVILLTGFGMPEERERFAKVSGVDAFLNKPINRSHLFDTIMAVFGQLVVRRYNPQHHEIDIAQVKRYIGGARVLLVEDVRINQQVAHELLAEVGIDIDIANHGREAVQRVEHNDYDAVLMDIQMPMMDGYEATRIIRADKRFEQLPILAMTAHAMREDQEKSVQAGMNGHLSKPIDRKELYAALVQWIKPRAGLGLHADPTDTRKTAPQGVLIPATLDGVDVATALKRLNDNHHLLGEVLWGFHQDYASVALKIHSLLAGNGRKDIDAANRLVHAVKGIAGTISARELFDAAVALEQGLTQASPACLSLLDDFERALATVMDGIVVLKQQEAWIKAFDGAMDSGTTEIPLDREKIIPLMQTLATSIRGRRFETQEIFDSLKPLLGGGDVEIQRHKGCLGERIARVDFKGAEQAFHALMECLTREDEDGLSCVARQNSRVS